MLSIKASTVTLNNIIPSNPAVGITRRASYVPTWRTIAEDLGINTLRINDGPEGTFNTCPNIDAGWENRLMYILDTINPDRTGATGLKIFYSCLGSPPYWGNGQFGIDDFQLGKNGREMWGGSLLGVSYNDAVNNAKSILDKLAGANNLGYNFLRDQRIPFWSVGTESKIGYSDRTLMDSGRFLLTVMDYIRSKGAKVIADSFDVDDWVDWNSIIVPMIRGHSDYLGLHHYGFNEYKARGTFKSSVYNGVNYVEATSVNWDAWVSDIQYYFNTQFNNAAEFRDLTVMTEWGIPWEDASEFGGSPITWIPEADTRTYYNRYFPIIKASPLIGISQFLMFKSPGQDGLGVVQAYSDMKYQGGPPNNPHNYPSGTYLPGATEVKAGYGGITPKIVFAGKNWTVQTGTWSVS